MESGGGGAVVLRREQCTVLVPATLPGCSCRRATGLSLEPGTGVVLGQLARPCCQSCDPLCFPAVCALCHHYLEMRTPKPVTTASGRLGRRVGNSGLI